MCVCECVCVCVCVSETERWRSYHCNVLACTVYVTLFQPRPPLILTKNSYFSLSFHLCCTRCRLNTLQSKEREYQITVLHSWRNVLSGAIWLALQGLIFAYFRLFLNADAFMTFMKYSCYVFAMKCDLICFKATSRTKCVSPRLWVADLPVCVCVSKCKRWFYSGSV